MAKNDDLSFDTYIKQFADECYMHVGQISPADVTKAACAYFRESPQDAPEILASDPDLLEILACAERGAHEELGVKFVQAMHAATETAINEALQQELERRADEQAAALDDIREARWG